MMRKILFCLSLIIFFGNEKLALATMPNRETIKDFTLTKIYKDNSFLSFGKNRYSNLVFDKNIAYYIDKQGFLVSLKPKTVLSNKKWVISSDIKIKELQNNDYKNYTPFISLQGNKLYITTGLNKLICINISDGKLLWSKELSSLLNRKFTVDNDAIYMTSSNSKTYAINNKDGSILWIHEGIEKATTNIADISPITYKNQIIVMYPSGDYYILSKNNGHTYFTDNASNSSSYFSEKGMIIIGRILYIYEDKTIKAVNLINHKTVWQKVLNSSIKKLQSKKESLYCLTKDNTLLSLDAKTGMVTKEKKIELNNNHIELLNIIDDLIILKSQKQLTFISQNNFDIIKNFKVRKNSHYEYKIHQDNIYFIETYNKKITIKKLVKK